MAAKPSIGFQPVPVQGMIRRFAIWDGNPPREPRIGEMYLDLAGKPVARIAEQKTDAKHFIAEKLRKQDR